MSAFTAAEMAECSAALTAVLGPVDDSYAERAESEPAFVPDPYGDDDFDRYYRSIELEGAL